MHYGKDRALILKPNEAKTKPDRHGYCLYQHILKRALKLSSLSTRSPNGRGNIELGLERAAERFFGCVSYTVCNGVNGRAGMQKRLCRLI